MNIGKLKRWGLWVVYLTLILSIIVSMIGIAATAPFLAIVLLSASVLSGVVYVWIDDE